MTVRTVLLSIQALLMAPEPDDPQDAVVATMYKQNQSEFQKTARQWRDVYAMSTSASCAIGLPDDPAHGRLTWPRAQTSAIL